MNPLIILNFIAFGIGFICDLYFKRKFTITALLWLIWSISTLFAVLYSSVGIDINDKVTLAPYIYFFLLFLISISPSYKIKVNQIEVNNKILLKFLLYFLAIIAITPFIENLYHLLDTYQSSSSELMNIYDQKMSENFDKNKIITWYDPISKIFNSILLQLQDITPILLFYYLTKPQKNKYVIIGLIMSCLNPLMYSLAMAGRGIVVTHMLFILSLYLLFSKKLSKQIKQKIKLYSLLLLGSFLILFIILTLIRYEGQNNDFSLFAWLSLYLGESTLNFNTQMWNARHLMGGDYSFSFFKDLLGLDTTHGIIECRNYWSPKIGFSIGRFFTFIGDILGDFGAIPTAIIICSISATLIKILHNTRCSISLSKIIIFSCWYKCCLIGFTTYMWGTSPASLRLVEILFLCLLLSYKGIHYSKPEWKKFKP